MMERKLKLSIDALKVQSMEMPPAEPFNAITTSATCPTRDPDLCA